MRSKLTAYLDRDIELEAPTSISSGGCHKLRVIKKNDVSSDKLL